jgi:hypothetical protein
MRDKTGKNSERKASPLDFFRKSTEYSSEEETTRRYSICTECPHFLAITKQCVKCGCFMQIKTKLAHAECPVNKW